MLNLTSFFQLELDAIGFYFVGYISWLSLPIVTGIQQKLTTLKYQAFYYIVI
jgi:hypothetical protein